MRSSTPRPGCCASASGSSTPPASRVSPTPPRSRPGGCSAGRAGWPGRNVVLFLLDNAAGPKADEVAFLADAGASAQNTILVISQADLIAADNPMHKAQEIARRVWRRFPAIAGAVVAVSGLMAEAGVCGVTERETAQISRRGQLESWELLTILDGGMPAPPGINVDELGRLEQLVGTYAMDAGGEIARQGARAYSEWLHRVSGIDELRLAIGRRFLAVGDILKARTVLAALRESAYRSPRRNVFLEAIDEAERPRRCTGSARSPRSRPSPGGNPTVNSSASSTSSSRVAMCACCCRCRRMPHHRRSRTPRGSGPPTAGRGGPSRQRLPNGRRCWCSSRPTNSSGADCGSTEVTVKESRQ